jgi:hypothetical protein
MTFISVFFIVFIFLTHIRSYFNGLMAYIIFRSIVDWGWAIKLLPGFSVTAVGSLIPIFFIAIKPRWIIRTYYMARQAFPLKVLFFLVLYSMLHWVIDIYDYSFTHGLSGTIRLSSGIAGAVLFLHLVNTKERYKALLISILVLGLISQLAVILQSYGFFVGNSSFYNDNSLVRNSGLSHGVISIRQYAEFGILASISLFFMEKKLIIKALYLTAIVIMCYGIISVHSKAGIFFLLALVLLTSKTFFRTKEGIFLVISLMFFSIILYTDIVLYVEKVFSKEILSIFINQQDFNNSNALNGRVVAWSLFFSKIENAPILDILLGSYNNLKIGFTGSVHNDFLLNFGRYGVVGLVIYILMIFSFIVFFLKKGCSRNDRQSSSRVFMYRGLVLIWIIDSIGLQPSLYPVLLMLLFGFLALSFIDSTDLNNKRNN